ncbi:secreted protein [Melampsora americana]|nr:secreted protein [Melampsora americana]
MISTPFFIAILASLVFSAFSTPITPSKSDMTYSFSKDIDWSNGTIYDSKGNVAVRTKMCGGVITYIVNNTAQAFFKTPARNCDKKVVARDEEKTTFTLHYESIQYTLYAWTVTRTDGTNFEWVPYSPSTVGINSVEGIVSLYGQPKKESSRIYLSQHDGTSGALPLGDVYTFKVKAPAPDNISLWETLELLYLLIARKQDCPNVA